MSHQSPAPQPLPWRFTPTWIEWACLVVGSVLIISYAWLMDDAYVYFRYIDNLVIHGNGLVWNPGEYVEGFSSPAWAIILSGLRALHLNYWLMIQALGLLCFVLFWWLCCIVNRGFLASNSGAGSAASLNLPLVYLSTCYGVLCYFTSGLEAPLVNCMAPVYAAAILWPQSWVLQLLVGVSPLVRQELAVPFVGFLIYAVVLKRLRPWTAFLSAVVSGGSYGLFRIWYYADIFPNTYYLKNITWISQGLRYLVDTFMPYQTVPYLLIMAVLYVSLRRWDKDLLRTQERLALVCLVLPVIAYVVKIGGDPRHFRYLAFPFIVLVLATSGLTEHFVRRYVSCSSGLLGCFLVIFGVASGYNYPRQLEFHPLRRIPMSDVNHLVNYIGDAAAHRLRFNRLTPTSIFGGGFLSYQAAVTRYAEEHQRKVILSTDPFGEVVPQRARTVGQTLAGIPITSDSWCQNGFLHPAIPIVHNLGLTEPFLAHIEMASDRPAHKYGLRPLALDILRIRGRYGFVPGAFDRAIAEDPATPPWIRTNIDSLRMIERKVYNQHHLGENLALALVRVPTIVPK